ncbi:uncharacterized protein C8A04DRAFT_28077 [Dichotomopilus funicola]|uniref:Uncharacterized protein n=1 Tax=Dichotomopilus funicola TaxID=1934379 RepID=A0AAN6V3R1_9PEZI|nr:hypothetical protein C8A04DRAFT_28077 [Dichotomopilus funicola]
MSDSQEYYAGAAESFGVYRADGSQENTVEDDGFVSETDSVETIRPTQINRQRQSQNQDSENQDLLPEHAVQLASDQGDCEVANINISHPLIPPVPDHPPPPIPAPGRPPPPSPLRLSSFPRNTLEEGSVDDFLQYTLPTADDSLQTSSFGGTNTDSPFSVPQQNTVVSNTNSNNNKNFKTPNTVQNYTNTTQPWILPPTTTPPLYPHSFTGPIDPLRMHPFYPIPHPPPSSSVPSFPLLPTSSSTSSLVNPSPNPFFRHRAGAGVKGSGVGGGIPTSATTTSLLPHHRHQHRYDGNPFTPRGREVRGKVDRMLKASRSLKPLVGMEEMRSEGWARWERLGERVGLAAVGVPLGGERGGFREYEGGVGNAVGSAAGSAATLGTVKSGTGEPVPPVESEAVAETQTADAKEKKSNKLSRFLKKLSTKSSRIFSTSRDSNTASKGKSSKPPLPTIGVPKPHQIRHVTGIAAVGSSTLSLPGFSLPEETARNLSSGPVLDSILDSPIPDSITGLTSALKPSKTMTNIRRRSRSLNHLRDPIPSLFLRENERVNVLKREKSLWVLGEGPKVEEPKREMVEDDGEDEEQREKEQSHVESGTNETKTSPTESETSTETPTTDAARTGPTPWGAPSSQPVSPSLPDFTPADWTLSSLHAASPEASATTPLPDKETGPSEQEEQQQKDKQQAPAQTHESETAAEQDSSSVASDRGAVSQSAARHWAGVRGAEGRSAISLRRGCYLSLFQLPPPPVPRQRVNPGRRRTAIQTGQHVGLAGSSTSPLLFSFIHDEGSNGNGRVNDDDAEPDRHLEGLSARSRRRDTLPAEPTTASSATTAGLAADEREMAQLAAMGVPSSRYAASRELDGLIRELFSPDAVAARRAARNIRLSYDQRGFPRLVSGERRRAGTGDAAATTAAADAAAGTTAGTTTPGTSSSTTAGNDPRDTPRAGRRATPTATRTATPAPSLAALLAPTATTTTTTAAAADSLYPGARIPVMSHRNRRRRHAAPNWTDLESWEREMQRRLEERERGRVRDVDQEED